MGSSATHRCPAFGCQSIIINDRLACMKHWKQLPEEIKREVNLSWAQRQRGTEGAESRHLAAMASAVEWWETR